MFQTLLWSIMWACRAHLVLRADLQTGPEQSLRLVLSLDSSLGLYFQTEGFSGTIQPLKNAPFRQSWNDCMTNLSIEARLPSSWHQRENLLLVSAPTLLLVQCLAPRLKAWFFSLFKWVHYILVSAPKCSRSLSCVIWCLSAGSMYAVCRLKEDMRLLHQIASTSAQMCHWGCYKGLHDEEEPTVFCCIFCISQQTAALFEWV